MSFDYFGRWEIPTLILCNPDESQLYALGQIDEIKYSPRFNALSEISFIAYDKIEEKEVPYYDSLEYKRLIFIENVGYFVISEIEKNNDGKVKSKSITAKSRECDLINKNLVNFTGTYNLYDAGDPDNGLLNTIFLEAPEWSIDHVDAGLLGIARTFDEADTNLYDFLMNTVEETYQCIFKFDTINKTISAYTIENATTDTDIFISFYNLIENASIDEKTDEMSTALSAYGDGDLSINQVNPLGTDTIYNFDYYKSTQWMSQGLINTINNWESLISASQVEYANLLTGLQIDNASLIQLESELIDLNSELNALIQVRDARLEQGLDISEVSGSIVNKNSEISTKESDITTVEDDITIYTASLTAINDAVSFSNNFSASQLSELDPFIMRRTYQNDSFVQTSIMSASSIQEQAQELYDHAQNVLVKVSQPRYEFSIDMVNFLALGDFSQFTDQLVLGATICLELEDGSYTYPVVLGYDIDYNNASNFSMIFGNRLRLDDSDFSLSDILNETVQQGKKTALRSSNWGEWTENYEVSATGTGDIVLSNKPTITNPTINGKIDSGSSLELHPQGNLILDPTGNTVLPKNSYDISLGNPSKKFLSVYAAEMQVETLVARETLATIGGRILVGPTTMLAEYLVDSASALYSRHNDLENGDIVYLEAHGNVEFMSIDSAPSGSGPYLYNVTRDLDGSGANSWWQGDAVFNTGQTGEGFIDIYSINGVSSSAIYGPSIVGNVRLSGSYNDWTEHWAVGNLNGIYGYTSDVYGVGLGRYPSSNYITIDSTSGIRFFDQLDDPVMTIGASGNYIENVFNISGSSSAFAIGNPPPTSASSGCGIWIDYNGLYSTNNNGSQIFINSNDGTLYSGNNSVMINSSGITIDLPYYTYLNEASIKFSHGGSSLGDIAAYYTPDTGSGSQLSMLMSVKDKFGSTQSSVNISYEGATIWSDTGVSSVIGGAYTLLAADRLLFTPLYNTRISGCVVIVDGPTFNGDLYVEGNCSAESFTDRTPFYEGDALSEIKNIKSKNGNIDHKSLPKFTQSIKTDLDGNETIERDLGATISMLTVAVQQLSNEVDKIKKDKK